MIKDIIKQIEENKPFYHDNIFTKLVTFKELETLLNLRPFMSDSRVRVLGPEQYEWYASEWTTDPNTFPPSLLETELKKYVFYIRECSRINQQVNDICKAIEEELDVPVDVHLYFSLIEEKQQTKHGFGIHRDKIDVMIIQSEGTSRFRLWNKDDKPEDSNPCIDELLKTGSVVFIPAGCWHEVISETRRISLSFAFGNQSGPREDRNWLTII